MDLSTEFPLSKENKEKGTRRLAREKVMQIILAHQFSETPWQELFNHIFFRKFKFEIPEKIEGKKLLKPEEIYELEADIPIEWNEIEIIYARELIKRIIEDKEILDDLIKRHTKNWELDRIANIDKIAIKIAIQEMKYFPEIPVKVSINEAIELSKKYSTSRSGTFVNGVIETIRHELEQNNQIVKRGKGLKTN